MSENTRDRLWVERFVFSPLVAGVILVSIMAFAVLVFCQVDGHSLFTFLTTTIPFDQITVGRPVPFIFFVFGAPALAVALVLRQIGRDMKNEEEFAHSRREIDTFRTIISEVTCLSHVGEDGEEMVFRVQHLPSIEIIARRFVEMMREIPAERFSFVAEHLPPLFMRRGVRASLMINGEFAKLIEVLSQSRKFASGKGLDDVLQLIQQVIVVFRSKVHKRRAETIDFHIN